MCYNAAYKLRVSYCNVVAPLNWSTQHWNTMLVRWAMLLPPSGGKVGMGGTRRQHTARLFTPALPLLAGGGESVCQSHVA